MYKETFKLIKMSNLNPKHKKAIIFTSIAILIIITFIIWEKPIENSFNSLLETAKEEKLRSALVLFSFLSLDILLPIPSSIASTLCGSILGFFYGFLTSFMAMNVSCAIGYILGRFFEKTSKRFISDKETEQLKNNTKNEFFFILAMRPIPVLAEASLIYAGTQHYRASTVTYSSLLSNASISAVYALIGTIGDATDSMIPAFVAVILLSAICMFIQHISNKTRKNRVSNI